MVATVPAEVIRRSRISAATSATGTRQHLQLLLLVGDRRRLGAGAEPEEGDDRVRRPGRIGLEGSELAQLGADVARLLGAAPARPTPTGVSPGVADPAGQLGVEAAASLPPLPDEDDAPVVSEREDEDDVGLLGDVVVIDDAAGGKPDGVATEPAPRVVDDDLGGERVPRPERRHHRKLAGRQRVVSRPAPPGRFSS